MTSPAGIFTNSDAIHPTVALLKKDATFQLKRDFGAKGDGSTDDTAALNAFIAAVKAVHGTGILDLGSYVFNAPLDFSTAYGCSFIGCGIGGSLGLNSYPNTRLLWKGNNTDAWLNLSPCRDTQIANLNITAFSSSYPGVAAVDIDDPISNNVQLSNLGIAPASGGTLTSGIRISKTAITGCDLHSVEHCYVANCTNAFDLADTFGESKGHSLYRNTFSYCTNGINQVNGSFTARGTNFSHNAIDVNLQGIDDYILLTETQSEAAGRFLSFTTASTFAWAVTISGARLAANGLNADGKYIIFNASGPLNLIGCDFANGGYYAPWRIYADDGYAGYGSVGAYGSVFPNNTIFSGSATQSRTTMLNNNYINSSGQCVQLPNSVP
jgi:hypothetical protein